MEINIRGVKDEFHNVVAWWEEWKDIKEHKLLLEMGERSKRVFQLVKMVEEERGKTRSLESTVAYLETYME